MDKEGGRRKRACKLEKREKTRKKCSFCIQILFDPMPSDNTEIQ